MSKIKIRLKLQNLELEIEGDREHIPAITQGVQKQVAGLLQAPAIMVSAEALPPEPVRVDGNGTRAARKRRSKSAPGEESEAKAIDFKHDPVLYGSPNQDWSTLEKAMWLIYVVGKQAGKKEMSLSAVTHTFNKHFRQAKALQYPNVWRDLGKANVKSPSLVGEDSTKKPTLWYLTGEGEKAVEKQIADVITPAMP
jgi:hypothetical protein